MNPSTLGFRKATKADFDTFGGAPADSMFLETDVAVVIYSQKERTAEVIVAGHEADPHSTYHRVYSGHYAIIVAMAAPNLLAAIKDCSAVFQLQALGLEIC